MGMWKIVDSSSNNVALVQPGMVTTLPAGAVQVTDYEGGIVVFGGSDTADQTFGYQVNGYIEGPREFGAGQRMGTVIVAGVATLGAKAYGAAGVYWGGAETATYLIADTITDTLTSPYATVYSCTDGTATLVLDLVPFDYIEILTCVVEAARADAFFIPLAKQAKVAL